MNNHYLNRLFWGLIVIAVGAAFLMRQSGFIQFDIGELASDFWPLVLIVIGLSGMLGGSAGGGRGSFIWAAIMIVLGLVFLGNNLGWITWSVGDVMQFSGPIVLILIGVGLIFKPRRKPSLPSQDDEWKSYSAYNEPVPPAPPLHPDPRLEPLNVDGGAAKEEHSPGRTDKDDHKEYDHKDGYSSMDTKQQWKEYRHAMRHARKHAHRSRHGHHDRVEWWNYDPAAQTRSGFIGDLHLGEDYWELKPMNISHFIGDTIIDLTKAQIPHGETKLVISSFIGDVKVFLPSDYEIGVQVISSAFLGDAKILGRKEGGLFRNMNVESPSYNDTDKKIRIVCSTFIGDVRVTKVG
ncbi:cell wall-active antibiotics response protein LiaF [Paenibacillus beijingensis]|uniref:Cell wall-active antibiotics response protein n=1 Tax=Paenibacillus beijingensis TaxID=1126833 RepID=A0A0D5NKF4_9BACL|nr:cell wall-active antibiotics response protein LiaF [Paenibacillus beijingensis]AJY75829.1 hypothetical protein VN24_16300 [Paenibacillus beijingensis]